MAQGLAIIGNCSYNALVKEGSIEWLCWPRPDSSFVFGPLLDREKGGVFTVEGVDANSVDQVYAENTNVLRTIFHGERGSFELIDFAPRFQLYDRFFKPSMLIRILRPISGSHAPSCAAARPTSTGSTTSDAGAHPTTSSSRASPHRSASRRTSR